jgi:L-rhamnose mutarotase
MFMIMETEDDFSFERKSEMDANNPKVQVWEDFVWKYQQALPMAKTGEKWLLMKQIFKL